ncbi:MAG: glycosyltransferase family 4 protein [Bauldia sp.]
MNQYAKHTESIARLPASSVIGPHGLVRAERPLRIVHCFRSPVGGLFRHVRDLVEAQRRAGHDVAIVCDSSTGGAFEERLFAEIAPTLSLGLHRFPMTREVSLADAAAAWRALGEIRALGPDVIHAHGAKGGAYARIIGTLLRATGTRVARIYTPHGGSLHYDPQSRQGKAYFAMERLLGHMTDAFVFVSQYEADAYIAKVGKPKAPVAIALNGLREEEFDVVTPDADARDFLFIGMMRSLKGPEDFIRALALIRERTGRAPTAWMVGDGDEKPWFRQLAKVLNLDKAIAFRDAMPARQAFALAHAVVAPSRAESMPYLILESIAAGMPTIATRVGGLPEIFGAESDRLVPAQNPAALADAMMRALDDPAGAPADAARLRAMIRPRFAVEAMAATVAGAYARVVTPR